MGLKSEAQWWGTWGLSALQAAARSVGMGYSANSTPSDTRMVEAAGTTVGTEDMTGWKRLTGESKRDLNPIAQRRMQELAVYQWKTSPLANRLIELPLAYLLAEGLKVDIGDEEAREWIDKFWNDPINAMDLKLPKKVRELAIFGEQCWPVFVNEFNGHVRLGYLDPGLIETVVLDPDNVEQPIGIVTRKDKKGHARRYRIIVNGPEDVFTERAREIREGFSDGDCFYFRVNDLSVSSRGHSDLLSQIDWIDGYENAMFGELERWDFLRAFIWDLELTGATPEEVKARAAEVKTPHPGSVRVHNEGEKWTAVTPDLKAVDAEKNARLMRNHVMGGGTIPEHWFGGGSDVNRATAGEMGEPTFKIFTMRQRLVGYMITEVLRFVVRMRIIAIFGTEAGGNGMLEDPDFQPVAVFPELTAKDTSKYAVALSQVVLAVGAAIDRGLMSEQTGIAMIGLVAGQLGLEIDATAELEAAREEARVRKEDDTFQGFGMGETSKIEEQTG